MPQQQPHLLHSVQTAWYLVTPWPCKHTKGRESFCCPVSLKQGTQFHRGQDPASRCQAFPDKKGHTLSGPSCQVVKAEQYNFCQETQPLNERCSVDGQALLSFPAEH